MPDLSANWDIPNAFGLLSADFGYDLTGYTAALGFLSDLAGGTDHDRALEINGGNRALLRAWQGNGKFRRVYSKARAAGEAEQEATRAREEAAAATEEQEKAEPEGLRFIPLEDMPVNRTAFSLQPSRGSWGE